MKMIFILDIPVTSGRVIQQLLCVLFLWTTTACTTIVDHNSKTNSNLSETELVTNGDIPFNEA